MKIILASASPRRHELLNQIGLAHTIEVSDVEETVDLSLQAHEIVTILAMQKAVAVAEKHKNEDCIVIGADTIVVQKNAILGKPVDEQNAKEMLGRLQGASHFVLTGMSLICPKDEKIVSDYVKTKVTFRQMREDEIEDYIKTGEFADKAGAYGIQGYGSKYVKEIEGDFFNVVGLPVCRLTTLLNERFGFNF